jgi:hypothetical protein
VAAWHASLEAFEIGFAKQTRFLIIYAQRTVPELRASNQAAGFRRTFFAFLYERSPNSC